MNAALLPLLLVLLAAPAMASPAQTPVPADQVQTDPTAPYVATLAEVITKGSYDTYAAFIATQLGKRRYAYLEPYYGNLQLAYEAGRIDDRMLAYAYKPFETMDPALRKPLSDWAVASPKSYAARLAMETYLRGQAWPARTGATSGPVRPNAQALALAVAETEKNLKLGLSTKPTLSLHNQMLNLRGYASLGLTRQQAVQKAAGLLKQSQTADPANATVRSGFMALLSPRWGGTQADMQTFAKSARAEGIPAALADDLDSIVLEDAADQLSSRGDLRQALPLYKEAARLQAPFYDFGRVEALKNYIQATSREAVAKDGKEPATPEYLGLLDLLLRDGRAITAPGWYYGQRGQLRASLNRDITGAWADFQRGAQYGDAASLYNVARVYCNGQRGLNVKKDAKLCGATMTRAAMAGSKQAETELKAMAPKAPPSIPTWSGR